MERKNRIPPPPGFHREDEAFYRMHARSYEECLKHLIAQCITRPKTELSSQKIGVRPASSFRAFAAANAETGVRFELNLIANHGAPLPLSERPSNVECTVSEFPDKAAEVGDALLTTALEMMRAANAGEGPPAFVLYGGFRVAETSHNVEFSLKVYPAPAPTGGGGFIRNDPATG